MRAISLAEAVAAVALGLPAWPVQTDYFVPAHQLRGIGAGRRDLSDEALAQRTEAMIQSQTFSIMREPQALPGAKRIFSPGLQRMFWDAERRSGFPASVLQAIAYLESWGIPRAESPAGPRGIMQISEATGRRMGLRISYALRHRVVKTKTFARNKRGKVVRRTVRRRVAYTVLMRDDRLKPERAIPAAALYLAGLERRYGRRDWAIWAYHCGEGCVSDFLAAARDINGLDDPRASVAKVFFNCSPVWNRSLYEAIHSQMDRDYSPTYWFRVMRAGQLLNIYREDPAEFQDLVSEYRYRSDLAQRAPDRLSAWLKPEDLIYETAAQILGEPGRYLVTAPDDPAFFGFRVASPGPEGENQTWYLQAFPSTIGTLAYIAFETRRLFEVMGGRGDLFTPLEVTALVLPMKGDGHFPNGAQGPRVSEHASGQVFDIAVGRLPERERECLQFVLDDLGWNGYLGFVEEGPGRRTLHIGCSPSAREFFARVYEDMQAARRRTPGAIPAEQPETSPTGP